MASQNSNAVLSPTEQAEAAKAEYAAFKQAAVAADAIRRDKRTGLILRLMGVMATTIKKEVELEYKEKRRAMRKDFSGNTEGVAYLTEAAALEADVFRDTVSTVLDTLPDAIAAIQEASPTVTEFLRMCSDNPKQTVVGGVRRVDFITLFTGLAEAKKAGNLATESVLATWRPAATPAE